MRSILILSLLLGVVGASPATSGLDTIHLSLLDEGGNALQQPVVRLVPIPEGSIAPRVRLLGADGEADSAAPASVSALDPMILRGLRVLPLVITPAPMQARKGATPTELQAELLTGETSAEIPPDSPALRHSRGFFESLGPLLVTGSTAKSYSSDEGSYLIITAPEFLGAVQPLAAWKREKGLVVTLVTTQETGGSKEQIQSFISELYHSSPVPPQFVLLVGDVEQIPFFDFHGDATDQPYALLDGDDFLPDLFVGRLSVQTLAQAETVVAKILRHERSPDRRDGGKWMGRGLVVASDSNAPTPMAVSTWCRQQLLGAGFTQVSSAFLQVYPPQQADSIRSVINRGVSLVTYRGWAAAERGWSQQFLIEDIAPLSNGSMLPLVCSFVCANNKYDMPTCFGEAWIRAGTAAQPQGAVAFIGNSDHWSHTRQNDAAAVGAVTGIRRDGLRGLGQILLASKMYILSQLPMEIPFDVAADQSVELYFYIYNLLGDPEMDLWTGAPRGIAVHHPEVVPLGGNFLEVSVVDSVDATPIEGLRVGVSQGDLLLGSGWTDARGIAEIPATIVSDASPVKITVTGRNVAPYQGTASIEAGEPFLGLDGVRLVDNGSGQSLGNGDGAPNPGETLELWPTLHNRGVVLISGGEALLTNAGAAEVISARTTFPQAPPGGAVEVDQPFVIRIPAHTEDRCILPFRLEAAVGADTSRSDLRLAAIAPSLRCERIQIDNGVLKPGETAALQVTVWNEGTGAASGMQAVLRSRNPELVTVVDSTATFDPIPIGASATSSRAFLVRAAATVPAGQAAALSLLVTTPGGWAGETSLSVPIGAAGMSAPLGPDHYGYWATDNSDTDYPATAPLYEWIECSPSYGGSGTRLTLRNDRTVFARLPFPFVFYGETYDSVQVSDNGWLSFDITASYVDFFNWGLPSPYGCGARVAPFWDNLDPVKKVNGIPVGDGVYTFYDENDHKFVVEWSRQGIADLFDPYEPVIFTDLQTFEVVLFDPAYHQTATGDGMIQFQYKQILNIDTKSMYGTVGIENMARDDGIQYTHSNLYPITAAPLSAGLAIRLSTDAPAYNPFRLAEFAATAAPGGVVLTWSPADNRPRGSYRVYRAAGTRAYAQVTTGPLDPSARSYVDRMADPDSSYSYKIGSSDPIGRETLFGPFLYEGRTSLRLPVSLSLRTAQPCRGSCVLSYTLHDPGDVVLRIYDVLGRSVRTLVQGGGEPGVWTASWNGLDDRGHDLPGGIYFAKLETPGGGRSLRIVLVR